jgi:nitrogen fixation-related uncharacterized protein
MSVIAFILLGSVVLLPAAGLLALRWATSTGQFRCPDKAALLPFEETVVEHDQSVANAAE